MQKPEVILKIESYISEKKKELSRVDQLQADLREKRPAVAFEEGEKALKTLDQQIAKADKEYDDLQTQIEGAKQQIKVETEKWIQQERERLQKEAERLEKEADAAAEETLKYQKKIEEINGPIHIRFANDGNKEYKLRWSAGISRRQAERVRDDILKVMSR